MRWFLVDNRNTAFDYLNGIYRLLWKNMKKKKSVFLKLSILYSTIITLETMTQGHKSTSIDRPFHLKEKYSSKFCMQNYFIFIEFHSCDCLFEFQIGISFRSLFFQFCWIVNAYGSHQLWNARHSTNICVFWAWRNFIKNASKVIPPYFAVI